MNGRSSRLGLRIGFVVAACAMAAAGTGCESGDFVSPPPPPSPRGDAVGARGGASAAASDPFVTGSTVRNIEMVQARDQEPEEALTERASARRRPVSRRRGSMSRRTMSTSAPTPRPGAASRRPTWCARPSGGSRRC